jgi:hypothetical protein
MPTTSKNQNCAFLKYSSSLNTVFLLKHSSSFLNMSQSTSKDFSYMGLLLHSTSWGSQATKLSLLANASTITWPSLFQQSKRDVRTEQWSNDALSTLLDLYEEKYLTFGHGSFWIKDWWRHSEKACDTYSCRKCKIAIQCRDKWDKMKKK